MIPLPPLLLLAIKSNIKEIYFTCISTIQIRPWGFFSPIPTNVPVCLLCSFHIIFFIMWFSLAIDNLQIKRIWLIFRASIYLIIFFLSVSLQLCCKIKLVYFWFHLNSIPNCVIVDKLFWPSVFQYTTSNHASGRIVVFQNFIKTYYIGAVKT